MARPRLRALKLSLDEACKIARRIYQDYGGEASLQSLSNITGNSLSSSSFRFKLNNLKLFGVVEQSNDHVILTGVGYGIAAPKSPQEELTAMGEAFLNVPAYRDFHERYKGKLFPDRERLPNILHREMGIEKDHADEWANSIFADLEAANLLDRRGGSGQLMVLQDPATREPTWNAGRMREEFPTREGTPPPTEQPHDQTHAGQRLEIGLSAGKGVVILPAQVTPKDIDLLTSLLNAIKGAASPRKS